MKGVWQYLVGWIYHPAISFLDIYATDMLTYICQNIYIYIYIYMRGDSLVLVTFYFLIWVLVAGGTFTLWKLCELYDLCTALNVCYTLMNIYLKNKSDTYCWVQITEWYVCSIKAFMWYPQYNTTYSLWKYI